MKVTKDLYFEAPTQVVFKEDKSVCDDPTWIGGIAYRDEIICGECGHVVSMVDVDTKEYRRKIDTKAVRRNVSLPSWLNYEVNEAGINVSQFLQDALLEKLNIQPR